MHIPRIVVGGTNSGVGKTSIATGIMAALSGSGLQVQGFKVGPDYIDPGYHTLATGRRSKNLDTCLFPADKLEAVFLKSAAVADISVIEGVMGLYDGSVDGKCSTAEIAKDLRAPVILVVDGRAMGGSAAAVVLGFKLLDPDVNLGGVILNRVGSEKHERILRHAIESRTEVPVIGVIGKGQMPALVERHLGLTPTFENQEIEEQISLIGEVVAQTVDLGRVRQLASAAPDFLSEIPNLNEPMSLECTKIRVAIALDEAFNFYYTDGLDYLAGIGIELVPFSPLHASQLPDSTMGLILGGGFPEMFLEQLSGNSSLLLDIKEKLGQGMPCYAECGGLMYLAQEIQDFEGQRFQAVGAVPGKCHMGRRLAGLGYRWQVLQQDCLLGKTGDMLQGHEFHYSTMDWSKSSDKPFLNAGVDGFAKDNIFASYLHLHWLGNPRAAQYFLEHCRAYAKRRVSVDAN